MLSLTVGIDRWCILIAEKAAGNISNKVAETKGPFAGVFIITKTYATEHRGRWKYILIYIMCSSANIILQINCASCEGDPQNPEVLV